MLHYYEKETPDNSDAIAAVEDRGFHTTNVILVYYAFTSLTTIGFGDYYPRSNMERIVISMYLLMGVALFSKIAGDFLDILTSYNTLHEIYEDSENLQKFFGVLKKFNWGQDIDK